MSDQLLMGVELMLLGMGTVFTFLILLVFVLKGMSALAHHLDDGVPQSAQAGGTAASPSAAPAPANNDARLVAVISAAVSRYRASRS